MSTEKIQVVVTAQDKASGPIKNLQRNVSALGSKTKGPLGGLLGGFGGISPLALGAAAGVGVLTAKLLDGVKGALEEEKQLGRLDVALRNNIANWDGNRDAVENAATAAADLAFADDQVREGIIKLLPVTKDQNKAIADSRLAMDIARGMNIEYAAAVDIVRKAEMGQVGALRRVGIDIDKTATSLEALTALQETYGGQAEKYASTTAGRVEAANVKINESFEDLGGGIALAAAEIMKIGDSARSNTDLMIDLLFGDGSHTQAMIQERADKYAGFIQDKMDDLAGVFKAPGAKAAKVYGTAFNDNIKKIRFGEHLTENLADELRDGVKDDIKGAMDDVRYAIAHPLALARQTAQLEGALTTLELKRGLASNTPAVNAVIDQQIQSLRDKWSSLTGVAYRQGVNASNALESGLRTFTPVNIGRPYTGRGNVLNGGRAAGGPVSPGGSYIVGERGPEIFTPGKRGGSITPNHAMGGGGDVYLDGEKVGKVLDRRMGRQLALSPVSAYSR